MADVYLAVSRGLLGFNKLVVLKRLRSSADDDGQGLRMFLDEARLAARLNHPNIVDTYDVGQEADSYFIAMEYLDGQPLSRILRVARKLEVNPTVWAHIMAEALHGLHHAHELRDYDGTPLQIVHRDVSPHNIFVTYEAAVKVVDFGIAKATLNLSQTEAGLLKGKIGYMPPEQALGQEVDRRADIFSAGVVLWEALAGRRLLEGGMATVYAKLVHSEVPKLADIKPDVDPALAAIVERALKKRPADRYETAADMRDALLDYLRLAPHAASKIEIGRLVTGFFAEHRASVQKEIEKHLATAARGPGGEGSFWDSTKILISHDTTAPTLSPTPAGSLPLQPKTATLSAPPTPASLAHGYSATPFRQSAPPPARRSALKVAAILALTASVAAGGLFFLLRYDHKLPASTAHITELRAPLLSIAVESVPSAAEVSWNGQSMGRTPAKFELPRGVQTLVVSKEGYAVEPVVLDLNEQSGPLSRLVTLRSDVSTATTSASTLAARRTTPAPVVVAPRSLPLRPSRRETNLESTRALAADPFAPRSEGTPASAPAPAAPPAAAAPAINEAPAAPSPPSPARESTSAAGPPPGAVDAKGVTATVRAHGGEVNACLERARMDRNDLHGRLMVQATIAPTGRVLSTSASSTIEGGARLQACILSAFQGWTFPAPAGGVNGFISVPFTVEP